MTDQPMPSDAVPEHECLLDGAHGPHHWWYTSEGGGYMLSAPAGDEKGLKRWWCPGLAQPRPRPFPAWTPPTVPAERPAEDWLAPIRARASAATPGPWTYVDQGFSEPVGGRFITAPYHDLDISTEDAEFIAGTREDVPRLLDEVDRLRATIQRVRELAGRNDAVGIVVLIDGQVAP